MTNIGRPKSDNPRDFIIPNVRISKEEKLMLELKSSIETKGNTAEFIRKTVKEYKPTFRQIHCCGKETEHILKTETSKVTVGDNEIFVKVKNAPYQKCNSCGEEYSDLRIHAKIEEITETKVHEIITKTRGRLPNEIVFDVNDWLNPTT